MSARKNRGTTLVRVEAGTDVHGSQWDAWLDRAPSSDVPIRRPIEWPGLWRQVRWNRGIAKAFEIPSLERLARVDGSDSWTWDAELLNAEFQEWVYETARGTLPKSWSAPTFDEVSSWFEATRLTVRSGSLLTRGTLVCDESRLRIRFDEVAALPDELPETTRDWIRELCLHAQSRWHLARFGIAGDRIYAEVDLSGVPAAVARPCFLLALEALTFTVGWALPSLTLVTDSSVVSRALDGGPWWTPGEASRRVPGDPAPHSATAG